MSKKDYVWLDCDPGIDDALAIILAYFSPSIELIGLSTVAGNCSLERATVNALNVLNIAGKIRASDNSKQLDGKKDNLGFADCLDYGGLSIPVIKGCAKSLIGENKFALEIHGDNGLNAQFPPTPEHALNFVNALSSQSTHFTTLIYEYFKLLDKKITILAIGPLTNIALLLLNYPDVKNFIEKIVIMGGSMTRGNVTPVAEFNIYVDPLASHLVFESNMNIFMLPLDVTNSAMLTKRELESVKSIYTPFGTTMYDLLVYYLGTAFASYGEEEPPLHDPCAAFFLVNPSSFEYKLMRVDVEINRNSMCYGQTVVDYYDKLKQKSKNVNVCIKMNVGEFWKSLLDSFKKVDNV